MHDRRPCSPRTPLLPLCGGALLVWATALAVPANADDWQALEPPGEGFRIELPGRAEPQGGEVETPEGTTYVRLYTLADEARRRIYSIAANRLPHAPKPDELGPLLDRTRDGAVKLVGGKVLDERDVAHGAYRGRSLLVSAAEVFVHARLYVADDRLYQVTIVSDARMPSAEDDRVFGSLKISSGKLVDPAPKYDWRFVTPRDEKFAVDMPSDPHEQRTLLDTPVGRVTQLRLESRPTGRVYFLQVCDLPEFFVGDDEAARFAAIRRHALQMTGGKVDDEQELTLAGRPGRALTINAGEKRLWSRSYLDGARVYQLGVVGRDEPTADDRRFLESLKLPSRE
jgi:hypothetical protein